jgi:hypothetical protein
MSHSVFVASAPQEYGLWKVGFVWPEVLEVPEVMSYVLWPAPLLVLVRAGDSPLLLVMDLMEARFHTIVELQKCLFVLWNHTWQYHQLPLDRLHNIPSRQVHRNLVLTRLQQ